MLKKAKAKLEADEAGTGSGDESGQGVLDSSHKIWLAGLGAFSRAQQEGMKVFELLVKQGEELQTRTKKVAADTAAAARGTAAAKAKEMQQMAGGTWDKLEQVFEDRVAKALSKLGVYTQNDVQKLAARVDELAEAVNKLVEGSAKPGAKPAAARATKRPAKAAKSTKPAASRKSPKAGAPKAGT